MKLLSLCLSLFALAVTFDGTAAEQRALPRPFPTHPGNVFLAGEDVVMELPKNDGRWSLLDYDGKELTALSGQEGKTSLGKLPVGFYRFRSVDYEPVDFARGHRTTARANTIHFADWH